jgi:hypothetical protein
MAIDFGWQTFMALALLSVWDNQQNLKGVYP